MNVFGEIIKFSIFGESHGPCIGASLSGIPAGIQIHRDSIQKEMNKRRPSGRMESTQRKETDEVEFISGILHGYTTGSPITVLIQNEDARSAAYIKGLIRPGHGDYPSYMKHQGYNDYRGGGHGSGRLTAPIVALGAIAKQILESMDIEIASHIESIHTIRDEGGDILSLKDKYFPVFSVEQKAAMLACIQTAKENNDSVGGVGSIETSPLPIGLGEPFFLSIESHLAHMMFSIPGIKGIHFGDLQMDLKQGSQVNDPLSFSPEASKTVEIGSNHQGGMTGGMTNGNRLHFSVSIRPTPTIGKSQPTINLETRENKILESKGRHDACIVPRVMPVVEAGTALVLLDVLMMNQICYDSH